MRPEHASPARVFLVEDHAQVRQQVAAIIARSRDFIVCGEAEDADAALSQIVKILPDLVILDLVLRNSSGMGLLTKLHSLYPACPVLVLSIHEPSLFATKTRLAGASGYITKQYAVRHLLSAMVAASKGNFWAGPEIGN